jgi:hypothetical protein
MRRVLALVFASVGTAISFAAGGCSSGPVTPAALDAGFATTGVAHDPCVSEGFRQPTPNAVVCPGALGCACGNGEICCLQAVDSSKGTCSKLGACRYLALTCDGPEDCAPPSTDAGAGASSDAGAGSVCCLDEAAGSAGGGSSCRPAGGCVGKVLCRVDDDCRSVPGLPHCRPADYGTPGVEDRGLDGLVGICER